jgi:proteasome lid subunit RPN8/RPN11
MPGIEIPEHVLNAMIAQARAEAPVEACGILAGTGARVEKLYTMTNADGSSDHFMMLPEEQFAVVKKMRSAGLEMLAIYHSHPQTPARPSQEDIRLALTPDVIHVILSLQDAARPVVKGFRIDNGRVTQVEIRATERIAQK